MKRTIAVAAAALMGSTALAHAEGVVNLYNWGNYTSPELLERFEAETGITVNVTDFDSNDTALARVRQGGHGFDIVVPSDTYIPTWISEGLVQPLDPEIVTDRGNIEERFVDVPFDPGREYSVPWAWGSTGITVNTATYDGDINDLGIIFDPPEELSGRINLVPEMDSVLALAIYYVGGESCTDDRDILRQVRDMLMEAKPHWLALDYGTVDNYVAGDFHAGIGWNGATMRARLQNPDIAFGYPQTGFTLWMDNALVLADAPNRDNAMQFINFILQPENAALISNFARYSNGIVGSEPYLEEVMRDAPEIVIPDELAGAGRWGVTCPQEIVDIHSQIWTELMQ